MGSKKLWIFGIVAMLGCGSSEPVCLSKARAEARSADASLEAVESVMREACKEAYGPEYTHGSGYCFEVIHKPLPEQAAKCREGE